MGYESDWEVDIKEIRSSNPSDPYSYDSGNLAYQQSNVSEEFMESWRELEPFLDRCLNQRCKWYEFDENLIPLSTEYPKLLITVTQLGEDGCAWRHYIHNGKKQTVNGETIYPPCTLLEAKQ